MSKMHVTTKINGDEVEFLADPRESLLDCLRDRLGLTGSKEGCGTGDCGACSVTLGGRLVCSCLVLGVEADGKEIGTIEGMGAEGALHPLQRKFVEHAAFQCAHSRHIRQMKIKTVWIARLPKTKFEKEYKKRIEISVC